ncbi:MAG: hypothetical protein KDH15_04500 [Rhodocyclaceae bacterium]|nr:hypothetical protein [Rhodocyclaceae bacterium]
MISRLGLAIAAAAWLGGCGVADGGSAVATVAAARKQELDKARAMQQDVQRELEAAMAERRRQLERLERDGR